MSTSVTTHNPVRSDLLESHPVRTRPASRTSRAWAVAGIGSAVAGIGTIVTSSMVDVVYRPEFNGTTDGVTAALTDKAPVMFAFHSITVIGALLMVVFAAGLVRRLRSVLPDGLAPTVAFSGLLGTAVVSVLGSGLDTEFMMGMSQSDVQIPDSSASFYNNWIGTIPWVWVLAGLAGLALFTAYRQGVVPRWIGLVGLVLGGLTVLLGVSPLEYMAGVTGALWLLATSIGFLVGDRQHRAAAAR
ncbi:hypothetical protein FB382_002979 [Nocardioides ginsengisegetis]|uniref:DUF4386 family protein n=1 Tax=Nocardioides ginsengisegetis TaxID=661491 RepID=A0A7W3PAJ7_9ACTN|nr:hypothetical protein [Nocardioides ginsengisegetis]MBA8804688.1 hypothetical protein [Nocardioides ginsengisegetis]